tara:strand:+ start:80 stop:1015 length:936 start_codon:yes stop_codon:yes gene_type:complete
MSKRLAQVLRAGEAHAQEKKKNWFNELPPEINEKILDKLPESALETCELVRNLCASGALSCEKREHILGLLRRIFFDPESQYSTNAGVESTLRLHFGDQAVATPAALKTLLGQLCEAYVAASDAILAMNPSMAPWLPATAFAWPAIRISRDATKYPLVPGDPQPIHAFLYLRHAADLLGNYHNLVVQEEVTERESMKNHALTKYDRLSGRPGARREPWTTVEVEPGPDYRRLFNAYEGSWIEVNSATRLGQLPPGFSDRQFQPLWPRKHELVRLKVQFRPDDTVREYLWYAKKRSKVSPALDEVFRIYPDR